MFTKKEEKRVVQRRTVTTTQTSQTTYVQRTIGSSSGLGQIQITRSSNEISNPSRLALPSTSTSRRASVDARPIASNEFGRQNPVYSSLRPSPHIYSNAETTTQYRPALPATLQSGPSKNKFKVKKTKERYHQLNAVVPTYKTSSKSRGEVLIINNIMFKEKGYRAGAKMDHKNLEDVFTQMGFKVTLKTDLKKDDIVAKVKTFSQKKNLNSVDIAFVIVMSHGTKNESLGGTEVFGLDEKGVLVDDLTQFFDEDKCKAMADKPKIFIFQCCRGDNEQFMQNDAQRTPARVPALTNALIAYSSLPGFVSHRDTEHGTWYINALCDVFSEHAHQYHIEDLLKMVDVKLSNWSKSIKQTTQYDNRGFKRCYLHPQ